MALESESEMYILYLMKKQHGFGRNMTETINKRMRPLNVGLWVLAVQAKIHTKMMMHEWGNECHTSVHKSAVDAWEQE